MKKKNSGFTLAEVLITLAVIGIIAALVIPVVTNDIQDAQYKAAWRSAFNNLSQATNQIINNNVSMVNVCGDWDSNCIKDKYLKYLSYSKQCVDGASFGTCWHQDGQFKYLNNHAIAGEWGNNPGAVLNNGTFLYFVFSSHSCTFTGWIGVPVCGWMYADVNGFKSPNVVGKDILGAYITTNGLIPMGSQGDTMVNTCNSNSSGQGCSAMYLMQ